MPRSLTIAALCTTLALPGVGAATEACVAATGRTDVDQLLVDLRIETRKRGRAEQWTTAPCADGVPTVQLDGEGPALLTIAGRGDLPLEAPATEPRAVAVAVVDLLEAQAPAAAPDLLGGGPIAVEEPEAPRPTWALGLGGQLVSQGQRGFAGAALTARTVAPRS